MDIVQTQYWGIKCRTCGLFVALGVIRADSPDLGHPTLTTGVFRCKERHRHVYYLEDESQLTSTDLISEVSIQENRNSYRSIAAVLAAERAVLDVSR